MRLDLHLHSTASDGQLPPAQVVQHAVDARLDVIALADHDTVTGVKPAMEAGARHDIQVVPALEMSSTSSGDEVHVLGYFIDVDSPSLRAHEARARGIREERMKGMIERLGDQGLEVSFGEVLDAAGPDRHTLGRPHLARAMVERGHVESVPQAFDRYIGDQHPAFIPTEVIEPARAVEIILEAGGIPVWAHPPEWLLDSLLPPMIEAGLRGLEVYRPRMPADRVVRLESAARRAGLLVSGGSDWHGPDSGTLGDFYVTAEEVGALLEAGGM